MNVIDKAFRLADRASKREKSPVFIHLTAYGPKLKYKHIGAYSQPVYMVNNGNAWCVTSQGNHYDYKPYTF